VISTINFGGTANVGAYTTKATATGDVFNGAGPLAITTFTDTGSASKVTFNLPTTLSNALTVGAGGLEIAGSGVVKVPNIAGTTAGLTLTNSGSGGLAVAGTVVVTPSTGINASAGKITFGGDTHSTTLVKATLKSSAASSASVAADGVITLATGSGGNNSTLDLANTGSIVFKGANAKLNINSATPAVLSGGSFTNTGATLTIGGTSNDVTTPSIVGTALTHLELGTGAAIAIPAAATAALIEGVLVDVSAGGTITVTTGGGKLLVGASSVGVQYAAGFITKYNSTGAVVVAGGHNATAVTTASSVTPFDDQATYNLIVTAVSTGASIQGEITGPATIDKNDTFTGAATPAITVTPVAN
jgi:hypothetical protein